MILHRVRVFIFLLILPCLIFAQDSLAFRPQGYAISGSLIVGGILLNDRTTKHKIRDWVTARITTSTNLDDYLQYAPISIMYLSDLALQSEASEVMRQTRHMLVTQGLTLGMVYFLKQVTKEARPNGGSRSFPSGHTAFTFGGATVLFHTYKAKNKCLAYSGFVPAIIVGGYRIIRDKHWVSDIVFGAGLGILCGYLSYDLDIWHSKISKKINNNTADAATFGLGVTGDGVGAYVRF